MAKRRMFSLDIVDTDLFLEMPATTQNLYFHLGMRADDDGFISSPKKIIRSVGASEDDFKILLTKGYLIAFKTGVCLISHWKLNNYIRTDRYTETIYINEKQKIQEDDKRIYRILTDNSIGIPKTNQRDTQYRKE